MPYRTYRLSGILLIMSLLQGLPGVCQLQAGFTLSKAGGCTPLVVAFTNTTTGASPHAVFHWDFGNGNTSSIANPDAIYTEQQAYTVTLTVQDGTQTSTATQTVTVYQDPVVNFSVASPKVCLPAPATFIDASSPGSGSIASYYWDFGDGSTQEGTSGTQTHNYNQLQTATVSLTVTNSYGCTGALQKKDIVTILPTLTVAFSADKQVLCNVTDPVQFTNTSTGPGTLSYSWDFGDGNTSAQTNPSHAFNKKGIYTVQLTANSSEGCTTTDAQTNYLNVADFSTDFTLPALICSNTETTINSISSPLPNATVWLLDGSDSYIDGFYSSAYYTNIYPTPGAHTLTLTNTYGTCMQTVSKMFNVPASPNLLGFVDSLEGFCGAPVTVQFRDTTPNVVKWEWDFDGYDGNNFNPTAFTSSPTFNYTAGNQYLVTLRVTNSAGCTALISEAVNIQKPYVNISYSLPPGTNGVAGANGVNGCAGLTVNFNNYSSSVIKTYDWNFGDGDSSSLSAPSHTYTKSGSFTVTLTVTDVNGCTAASTTTVNSIDKPAVSVLANPGTTLCGNTPVVLTLPVTTDWVTWNYGDNSSSGFIYGDAFTTHQYARDGTYTVTAIFGLGGGCVDMVTQTNFIKVLPPFPHISESLNTCDGDRGSIVFADTSYKANSLTWNFGDGSPPLTFNTSQTGLTHTYTQTGSYNVTLSATNGQCTTQDIVPVYVLLKQHPKLTAGASAVCSNGPLTITISNMQVNPAPDTYGSTYYSYYGLTQIQYGDSSTFTGGDYQGYQWLTTDSFTLYGMDPGKKDLRVISTSTYFNCQDTSNFIPVVFTGATAGFEALTNNVCFQSPVVLKDTSVASPGDALKAWLWNFGDGTVSSQAGTVSHTYASPGYYPVTLTVTDAAGCLATTPPYSQYVSTNGPQASFSPSGTNVPLNTTVQFYNESNSYGSYNTSWQWTFGDGAASTDVSPSHTYTQPGAYTVTLIATDGTTGCSSQTTAVIVVRNFNSAFSFSAAYISGNNCPPALVQFTNTSSNYSSVSWDFGDGLTAGNINYPSHIYQQPGKYIVTLYVYGPNGLTGQYSDSVVVQRPAATLTAAIPEICIGQSDRLNASATGTLNYTWDFGDGSIDATTIDSVTHIYPVAGTYLPKLIVTDSSGCSGSADINASVTVRPDPVITLSPAQPYACLGGSVTLQAGGGSMYSWSPSTGLSQDNISSPVASPTATATYQLQVTDDIGCQSTEVVTVTVVDPESVALTPDTSICDGNAVKLQATGAEVYNWIGNTSGLSDSLVSDPIARPAETTTYTVTGSDSHACFSDTAAVTVEVLPAPTVSAGPDIDVLAGNPFQIDATGSSDIVSWNWAPADYLSCSDCAQPSGNAARSIQYTVTATGSDGCTASDTVNVNVTCEESRVAIPNAFTPNGDGKNDLFIIKGISLVRHLVIFDRWGEKVFERNNFIASDRSSCWDGTFNGAPVPTGIYVYFAEMQCSVGGVFSRKGTVILIR